MKTNDYSKIDNIVAKVRIRMSHLLEGFDGHLYAFEQDAYSKLPSVLIKYNNNIVQKTVTKVCLDENNEIIFYIPEIGWISYKLCLQNSECLVYSLMDKCIFG